MNSDAMDQTFSRIQSHQKRREATFKLLLAWILLACLAGVVGFVFGLFYGSGDTVQGIAAESFVVQVSLAVMPVIVVALAFYCIRKTREFTRLGS